MKRVIGTAIIERGSTDAFASHLDTSSYSHVCIVSNSHVTHIARHIASQLDVPCHIVTILPGESHKSIRTVEKLWRSLYRHGADRSSLVINIGGGMTSDIGGFAASTYMRGIDFINVPTSLLAQVDASIGGKTGCNFAGIKNLVGTITQPIITLIDPDTLATLPARELASGFGEILKHGLVADRTFLTRATAKRPTEYTSTELAAIIADSCAIKHCIVSRDPTERGERKLVNFGHTIGHAIESASFETNHPLLHGEAIGIGMLAEAHLSYQLDMLTQSDLLELRELLRTAGLPTAYHGTSVDQLLEKMRADKKNHDGRINFTLLERIGKGVINQYPSIDNIRKALLYVLETKP